MTKSKLNYREQNGCHNCKYGDYATDDDTICVLLRKEDVTPHVSAWQHLDMATVVCWAICDKWEPEMEENP